MGTLSMTLLGCKVSSGSCERKENCAGERDRKTELCLVFLLEFGLGSLSLQDKKKIHCDPRPKNVWGSSLTFLSLLVLILQSSPLWANNPGKQTNKTTCLES